MSVPDAFAEACRLHQAGRLNDAESLYRRILAIEPAHAESLHHLGILAHQAGRTDLALDLIRQAIVLVPDHSAAHFNLGAALAAAGRVEEAKAAFRHALALDPRAVEAHLNLGVALAGQGALDEAIAHYRQALDLDPDFAPAHYNLANALRDQERLEEAIAEYRRALALQPDSSDAWVNLGAVFARRGSLDEAIDAYRQALDLQPGSAEALNNLGEALLQRGRVEEALAAVERSLEINPAYPGAHLNRGNVLREVGRNDEAMAAYRRALAFDPRYADAHNNLGVALVESGRIDEGVAAHRSALALNPSHPEACNNLGFALMERGEWDDAIASFRQAVALHPGYRQAHSSLICALQWSGRDDQLAPEFARWNLQFDSAAGPSIASRAPAPVLSRRIKIGYVSPDLRSHPIAFFFAPLLEAHDRTRFEIYCYASVRRPDAITARLRASADTWRDVRGLSDSELADLVRQDGIDILVDLAMHTAGNRLGAFVRHPAPVQVSWLAYPGTTGIAAIDYRLTDPHLDPPVAVPQVQPNNPPPGGLPIHLPDAWCCYAPIADFPEVSPLPALQNGFVTFGSLNRFNKLNEPLLRCWARLLAEVPDSRLVLIAPQCRARELVRSVFAAGGIALSQLDLVDPSPWPRYIRLFAQVDIALDAYPCNGLTTTCHALWMGLPVVTRAGAAAVSRSGHSLLHTAGLGECLAHTEADYLRIATEWASDIPRLAALRAALRSRLQSSPLMDASRFARHFEAACHELLRRSLPPGTPPSASLPSSS